MVRDDCISTTFGLMIFCTDRSPYDLDLGGAFFTILHVVEQSLDFRILVNNAAMVLQPSLKVFVRDHEYLQTYAGD